MPRPGRKPLLGGRDAYPNGLINEPHGESHSGARLAGSEAQCRCGVGLEPEPVAIRGRHPVGCRDVMIPERASQTHRERLPQGEVAPPTSRNRHSG